MSQALGSLYRDSEAQKSKGIRRRKVLHLDFNNPQHPSITQGHPNQNLFASIEPTPWTRIDSTPNPTYTRKRTSCKQRTGTQLKYTNKARVGMLGSGWG